MQTVTGKSGEVEIRLGYNAGVRRGRGQGLTGGLGRLNSSLVALMLPPDEIPQGGKEHHKGSDYDQCFFMSMDYL